MKTIGVAAGKNTGHRAQRVTHIVLNGHPALGGRLAAEQLRDLIHVLRVGCRATGRDFTVSLPKEDQDD